MLYENEVITLTSFFYHWMCDKIKHQNFSFNCQIFYNYLMYCFITDKSIAKKKFTETLIKQREKKNKTKNKGKVEVKPR